MFWKFLFVAFILIFTTISFFSNQGYVNNNVHYGEFEYFTGYLFTIFCVIAAAYFFALGWKKRLFSLKANKFILIAVLLNIIISIISVIVLYLQDFIVQFKSLFMPNTLSESSLCMIAISSIIVFSGIFYLILYSPLFITYFKYKKHFNELEDVHKPAWKIFSIYYLFATILMHVVLLRRFSFADAKVFDYFMLVIILLNVLSLILYAFNLKCGKQFLWKIFSIIFVITIFLPYSLASQQLQVIYLSAIQSKVSLSMTILLYIFYSYSLFRYAFSDDVYKQNEANN